MREFDDMDAVTLRRVLHLVREHTGIAMVDGKKTMLQARLRPRIRSLKLASYAEYVQVLSDDESEQQPFIDAVTTHHTTFFRTPKVWQYFRDVFLPRWIERNRDRIFRAWSAAASTGEEACSIAICCEELRRQQPGFNYEILATDISTDVLAQARLGQYSGSSVDAFRASDPLFFTRYNVAPSADQFELSAPLRSRITFSPHNLLASSPLKEHFDVVFLRNVLIYFSADDTRRIVHNIAPALRERGGLIIGESESLTSVDVPFLFVQPQVYELARA